MATLQPLPAPGVAAFPEFLSEASRTITLKGKPFSSSWTATHGDESGEAFLKVDSEKMSMSHRKHLLDPRSGKEICEIRKETFSRHSKYYGVVPGSEAKVFDAETHFHLSGNETTLHFVNNAAGGQQDSLEFKKNAFSSDGSVTYKGKEVAIVDKKKMSMSGQYNLHVAAGFDPFLIVALAVVLADMEASRNSGAAAGGAAAGGGGGGG